MKGFMTIFGILAMICCTLLFAIGLVELQDFEGRLWMVALMGFIVVAYVTLTFTVYSMYNFKRNEELDQALDLHKRKKKRLGKFADYCLEKWAEKFNMSHSDLLNEFLEKHPEERF